MDLIAYYRVSTKRQGVSGLGLEAQQVEVERHAKARGARVLASYTEVESGKTGSRVELRKALGHARRAGAALIVAKLDRLARDAHFVSGLLKAGVEFVACDAPFANKVMIQMMSVFAEYEHDLISARAKAVAAVLRSRGVKLGAARPGSFSTAKQKKARLNGLAKARKAAKASKRTKAIDRLADLLPVIRTQRKGGMTLKAIADQFNDAGQPSPRNCKWTPATVRQALNLLEPRPNDESG